MHYKFQKTGDDSWLLQIDVEDYIKAIPLNKHEMIGLKIGLLSMLGRWSEDGSFMFTRNSKFKTGPDNKTFKMTLQFGADIMIDDPFEWDWILTLLEQAMKPATV